MRIIELDEQGMLARLAVFLNDPGADGLRLERIANRTGVPHTVLIQIIAGAFEGEIPRPLLDYARIREVTRYECLITDQCCCRGDD